MASVITSIVSYSYNFYTAVVLLLILVLISAKRILNRPYARGAQQHTSDLDGLFHYATEHMKTLVGTLDSEDLLFFYGRYKQSTIGPCNVDKPSFLDFTAKPKWNAWKNIGDMSKECAKNEYIQKLCSVDPGWLNKISESQTRNQFRVAVSSMAKDEKDLQEEEKTFVDWMKEGNLTKLRDLALKWTSSDLEAVIQYRDENGLGVIHWASDRGNKDIVKMLLDIKDLDVNLKDNDGQTALHYASSCGHLDVVQTLIDCPRVDRNIRDDENLLPEDSTTDNKVIRLLQQV